MPEITTDIALYHKASGQGSYTKLGYLMEVPDIGGTPEKIEITCFGDNMKKYANGIKDPGDLEFMFLYDNSSATSNYTVLKAFEDADSVVSYKVEYPDGTTHIFDATVSVRMNAAKTNEALTCTASFALQSEITVAGPSASTGLTTPFVALSGSGTLVPTAAGNVYEYVYSVASGVSSVTVTPTATAGTITVTAGGATQTVATGQASTAIILGAAGSITTITVNVVETGKTEKTYVIKVVRAA